MTVVRAEFARHTGSAGGQVATRLAGFRNARQAIRHRATADHQHTLVAIDNRRQILLRHDGLRAIECQRLDDHRKIRLAAADAKDAGAAHAVERLEYRLIMLRHEGAQFVFAAGDKSRRGELRKLGDRQLLVVVAQGARIVEHPCTVGRGAAKQVGRVKILHVEWRILAHQHRVECRQRLAHRVAGDVPVGGLRRQIDFASPCMNNAYHQQQIALQAGMQLVAARGGLDHHREGRILVGLEIVKRIGDKQQAHGVQAPGAVCSSSYEAASAARRAITP